ncbi:MAG: redox-sensing transcriptional repressor Rex [Actinobacteria bacterium]|nr:redox-sensing transcriptional repressor Rex [Actinomycetota bacterium]
MNTKGNKDTSKNHRKKREIPQATLQRLPFYLRALYVLDDEGFEIASSTDIAEMTGSYSAQVRKDLSYLGEFGRKGVGYSVKYLIEVLEKSLGVSRTRTAVLVGVGRLGEALLLSRNIRARGFEFVAAFDKDPEKIGKTIAGVPIFDFKEIEKVLEGERIDIGVIAVSSDSAQEVADKLVKIGVKGILNFVPVPIRIPQNVPLRTVCIAAEMQILSYQIKSLRPRQKRRVR